MSVETREQLAGINSLSIVWPWALNLVADAPAEQSVRLVHGTNTTVHLGCQPWHQMPSTTVPSSHSKLCTLRAANMLLSSCTWECVSIANFIMD